MVKLRVQADALEPAGGWAEALDHMEFPQRPIPLQPLAMQLAHQGLEFGHAVRTSPRISH